MNADYLDEFIINSGMHRISKEEMKSADDTYSFAERLAKKTAKGSIYCLIGDLGTGKTLFAKGFAKGLGVEKIVNSPTFTIVQEYKGSEMMLYHFDVYRINDPDELYEIGFDEYLFGEGVCLIEWADLIEETIPENAEWIYIKKDLEKGTEYRSIEIYKK